MGKIAVVFNGGTISMAVDSKSKGVVPALTGEEIISKVKDVDKCGDIECYNFSNCPGPHVTPNKMLELSKFIQKILLRDDIEGAVITHGTDTLEETAYFLDLTIKSEKPVVVTGSMKNSSELGYDGPANLKASISIANSRQAINRGVMVCLNNEINCASEVTKMNSMKLNTFESCEFGPIGIVDDDKVIFYRDTMKKIYINTDKIENKVYLIKCVAGIDSSMVNFCIEDGAKGIIIEGFGRGNVCPKMLDGIKKAIDKGIVVVIVSRCCSGRVLDTYGYEGGGKQLRDFGAILGGDLTGQKARIKLMIALGYSSDINFIKDIFEKNVY